MQEFLLSPLDIDYVVGENNKPVIRIFGKTDTGRSILVLDKSFEPYFYVLPKEGKFSELKEKLEKEDFSAFGVKEKKVENAEKILEGVDTEFLKFIIDNPAKVPDVREFIKSWVGVQNIFEFDIPFYKRYLIDKQIEPFGWVKVKGDVVENPREKFDLVVNAHSVSHTELEKTPELKVLAFDIELIEENGKEKLIMLSVVCNNGFKKVVTFHEWDKKPHYVEVVKSEKEIIERFVKIIEEQNPDIICAYNSDNFDFQRLKERAAELKVSLKLGRNSETLFFTRRGKDNSAKIKGRVHIDVFNFVSGILKASLKSEVLTLDSVASQLLGEGKKKMKYSEMVEFWGKKKNVERIAEYCLWDSELALRLFDYTMPQISAISKLTGMTPFDVSRASYSQLVEGFFMRKAFADNIVAPNRPHDTEIEKRRALPVYKGAIVIEPKSGIHNNILVFDFRSLYPTIIVSHNISPETFNCPHRECREKNTVPDTEFHFCTKQKGFISKHLGKIIENRQKVKAELKKAKKGSEKYKVLDNMQYALKIIANATYGYFGFFGAKWYKRECGGATAALGRYYITKVVELAKKDGFEIIYGDTDSLMARYLNEGKVEKLKEVGMNFAEKITEALPGIIELEFRGLYEGGIFVTRKTGERGAKKRYALIDYAGNIEIRGFETVRRDWCELAKRIQREVLTIVLKEKNPERAVQLVRETSKKIREGKAKLEELAILEQITRPLSQYEQIGPHVKAAMKAKKRGREIITGTVMSYVVVKGKGSISERSEPLEDVKENEYDPVYYIEHQIVPAALRILEAVGYKEEDLLGKKQSNLLGY